MVNFNLSKQDLTNLIVEEESTIKPKKFWTIGFINSFTFEKFGFCVDNLYDYDIFNDKCKRVLDNIKDSFFLDGDRDLGEIGDNPLDEHMWEQLTTYIEECRQIVFETYKENGVSECESYFLSLKFLWSTLKKFRNRLYRELDNREDYDRTPLKIAVNHLINRIQLIMADKDYQFSKEAANGKLSQFKKEASWEVLKYLAEETGIIFHAKLTL